MMSRRSVISQPRFSSTQFCGNTTFQKRSLFSHLPSTLSTTRSRFFVEFCKFSRIDDITDLMYSNAEFLNLE
ncbi:Hypothetical predicted protein [Octopus vulgaris]|uniref:Uncharacterized protein n=1 Tax=Octopus vulgaris TaxID=6645 RepID=A0AA36FBZ1_OCTVU|nr:Hypothetical predicted protein [Octopus vulgaris]